MVLLPSRVRTRQACNVSLRHQQSGICFPFNRSLSVLQELSAGAS